MASVNKITLLGNLGADPEVRYTGSGDAVANVRLATTETWKDKQTGDRKEATEWHRVVFYGRLAEIVGQYLKKGRSIYLEGRLRTRKWQSQDGQDRYTTEVIATDMKMLGSRMDGDMRSDSDQGFEFSSNPPSSAKSGSEGGAPFVQDDDIPF